MVTLPFGICIIFIAAVEREDIPGRESGIRNRIDGKCLESLAEAQVLCRIEAINEGYMRHLECEK